MFTGKIYHDNVVVLQLISTDDNVLRIDADECLYHSERHELMLYLFIISHEINNQQYFGKYGLGFLFMGF